MGSLFLAHPVLPMQPMDINLGENDSQEQRHHQSGRDNMTGSVWRVDEVEDQFCETAAPHARLTQT